MKHFHSWMQFYGSPSTYLWEDEEGVNHEIPQGEGGEQGDPLMLALFALGLHQALLAVQANLLPSERLLAFLDDIYVVCSPERVSDVYASLQHELWRHSRIEVHQGKTQLWNRDGVMPSGCEAMTIAARAQDENAPRVAGCSTRRSNCWALLLVMLPSWKTNWRSCLYRTACCLSASRQ